jgi:hypothetical protein
VKGETPSIRKMLFKILQRIASAESEIEGKRGAKRGQIRSPTTQPTTELNAPPTLLVQPSAIFECYKESPEQNVAESK